MAGVDKVLDLIGRARRATSTSVSHGTTVATNPLLEGKVGDLGFITTEGFEFVLEIARQSVPDGYGNSYFWVKPPRIVPPHRVQHGRRPARPPRRRGAAVRRGRRAAAVARWFREQGIDTIGVCFLHSYANPDHERRMRDVLRARAPRRGRVDLAARCCASTASTSGR